MMKKKFYKSQPDLFYEGGHDGYFNEFAQGPIP